jgi:hypothetical protein
MNKLEEEANQQNKAKDHELSMYTILSRMEADDELLYVDADSGIQVEVRNAWHSDFMQIEQFVLDVIDGKQLGFKINKGNDDLKYTISKKGREYFDQFFNLLESDPFWNSVMKPSIYVELYFKALEPVFDRINRRKTHQPLKPKPIQEVFNEFIEEIVFLSKTGDFLRRIRNLNARATQNIRSAKRYVDGLFERYSKLLVIRIDLSYLKEYASTVTAEQARQDLQHLLNNRRSNKFFEHWVGYIAKLEYGVSHGYHFHLIVFMDGQHVQHDFHIANEIGKHWKETVTKGWGLLFNCNAWKSDSPMYAYKRVGIGMINHDDVNKRHILVHDVIAYLCKKEQSVKTSSGKNRVFTMGVLPKRKSAAGRPRKSTNLKGN